MDFFKSKVKGSQQKDRFVLSTFEGSPTCSAKAWVEELKTMLQQHKVSKGDAIRFAALHFRGKTYAWWIFESCSLKDANNSSYFRFIGTMMERFGGRKSKTHAEKQTKILHVKGGNIN